MRVPNKLNLNVAHPNWHIYFFVKPQYIHVHKSVRCGVAVPGIEYVHTSVLVWSLYGVSISPLRGSECCETPANTTWGSREQTQDYPDRRKAPSTIAKAAATHPC